MYTFLKKLVDLHYKKHKNYLIYQKITSFTIFSYKNNWISIIPPNFAQFLGSQIHLDRTKVQFPIQQVRPSHHHPHGTTTRLSSVVPPCVVLCAAATTPHYFSSSSSLQTWTWGNTFNGSALSMSSRNGKHWKCTSINWEFEIHDSTESIYITDQHTLNKA